MSRSRTRVSRVLSRTRGSDAARSASALWPLRCAARPAAGARQHVPQQRSAVLEIFKLHRSKTGPKRVTVRNQLPVTQPPGPCRGLGACLAHCRLGGNTSVLAYTSERLRNVSTGPTSNEENKQVSMPVSRRVIMPSHFPMSHAAIKPFSHTPTSPSNSPTAIQGGPE